MLRQASSCDWRGWELTWGTPGNREIRGRRVLGALWRTLPLAGEGHPDVGCRGRGRSMVSLESCKSVRLRLSGECGRSASDRIHSERRVPL